MINSFGFSSATRAIALVLLGLSASASAITLDIDSLPTGMSNSPGQTVPTSNRFTDQRQAQGVVVTSTGGFVAVVAENGSTGTGWKRNDPSVKAGLGGSNPSGALSYGEPVTFTFVDPTNATMPYATDSFSLYTDWFGDGSFVILTGYDDAGNQVAQTSGFEQGGQADFGARFSLVAAGIHRVVFQGSGTTGVGNVQFGQPTPVPEPASFAALGVGALTLLRRRKTA